MLLGSARLLEFETAFVDRPNRVELVDGGVDAEIPARSKGEMLDIFDFWIFWRFGVRVDRWWEVDTPKFIDELC